MTYGVEKFVQKCRERVLKFAAVQTEQSKRLGMWADWGNDYYTMSDENNYAIWNFLKVCHQRDGYTRETIQFRGVRGVRPPYPNMKC